MENETKKEYVAPEMRVVEIEHQANLLACSGNDDSDCYDGNFGMNYGKSDIGHV